MWQKGYDSMEKVGVSQEEKQLSYYKYFEQDLAPIPIEKLTVLAEGPQEEKKAVPFEQKDLFLAGRDEEYCQTGYGVMDDGTGFVCNTTYMPGRNRGNAGLVVSVAQCGI